MIDHSATKLGRVDDAPTQYPSHGAGQTGRVCRRPSWASPPVPVSTEPTGTAQPLQSRIAPSHPAASGALRC